jgi:hypothetical protein
MKRWFVVSAVAVLTVAAGALPGATQEAARQHRMNELFSSPNATGATSSDMAFWGDLAFTGNYDGFRIFDISQPASPTLITDFRCFGPQNDVSVWDRDGDGEADILFTSIDRTLTGPACGSTATAAHDDPTGWEGIRVFDVSDPAAPVQIDSIYQDCGSHTHTLVPDPENNRVVLYNPSYPLRPGPTCGPVRGPAVGRDPLHGVLQVVEVSWGAADPLGAVSAEEIAEPPVNYPGDPDNLFDSDAHSFPGFLDLRACHDIGVYLPDMLAAGACSEQAQLWRIDPDTLIPDTANPLWVFDNPEDTDGPGGGDAAVDFWHSATFSWDGQVVNFSDESFGIGCPPVTNITDPAATRQGLSDTGRTYFLDVATGEMLSDFQLPRTESALDEQGNETAYCSTHQGNTVLAPGRNILVQAWYMGGVDVIDFTDPTAPQEIAFFDFEPAGALGSDVWSHYWYERNPRRTSRPRMITFALDGVHNPPTGRGFQVFETTAFIGTRIGLDHLNPQTQEIAAP